MIRKSEKESNYDKIVNYFGFGTPYTKKEVIDGLIELELAPKGKNLVSKLVQNISLSQTRSKQLRNDEEILIVKFIKRARHSSSYELIGYNEHF